MGWIHFYSILLINNQTNRKSIWKDSSPQYRPTGPPPCMATPSSRTHTSTDERSRLKTSHHDKHETTTIIIIMHDYGWSCGKRFYHKAPGQRSSAQPREPAGLRSFLEDLNSTSSSTSFLTERENEKDRQKKAENIKKRWALWRRKLQRWWRGIPLKINPSYYQLTDHFDR